MDPLVLGPMMRHVDTTSACIWVETAERGTVRVETEDGSWTASTFVVHGHHYALVEVDGLRPGTVTRYSLSVNGDRVWPRHLVDDIDLPPPAIATIDPQKRLRLAFGSCRTSVGHDQRGNATHGVDALHAYAIRMATDPDMGWPDLMALLGDQVYADETSEAMREFIASRRDIDEPPGTELKDYQEYAHLYRLAWSEPVLRWLLSTLPSAMIFDDHDVRDDWNTSAEWREMMEATDWWHDRIVAALTSYWVYQHAGNLSSHERGEDEIWRLIREHDGDEELDLSDPLDALSERVNEHPESYRWSFHRDLPDTRLVVLDSRAARVLDPGRRSMLDPSEWEWLSQHMTGDVEHLLVGTSLPFLLPPGLHNLEAFDEALAAGKWGKRPAKVGEWMRQTVDLEHWAAFNDSFAAVAELALDVAYGRRGRAPRVITFLGGDVHHSYVSQVVDEGRHAPIVQAVCSPIRNPLPRWMRFVTAALSYGLAAPMGLMAARSSRVPTPPFRWERVRGPWFDNNLAVLELDERALDLSWFRGRVRHGRHDRPVLERASHVRIDV